MKNEKYYLGLDIGTDSVGYAVTDERYGLLKFKGEPMWGATVFEAANQAQDRRAFRTARRRLDRRQQRVKITEDLFAAAIAAVDPGFFVRRRESALFPEDASSGKPYAVFDGEDYNDKDYNRQYPTVHHLIVELMEDPSPHDVRLVYIAVAWMMAHRGNFLSDVDKNNISGLLDMTDIYADFENSFTDLGAEPPWSCDLKAFGDILKKNVGVTVKEREFFALLFDGKKPKPEDGDPVDKALLIKLLSGGKTEAKKLFCNEDYASIPSFSLHSGDDEFAAVVSEMDDDDASLVVAARALYDWALLSDILSGSDCISKAKVAVYEQHKKDLRSLKAFIRKYAPEKYDGIFKAADNAANYAAYTYNERGLKSGERLKGGKASPEAFCDYLKKEVRDIQPDEADRAFFDDMLARLDSYSFMPKQVTGENRVIPYQLYWTELDRILKNAEGYLPFLAEKDADGISVTEKLLSVFEFRVPYFVGPLAGSSPNSWAVRKKDGRIYPWNIRDMIDFDASEREFIDRMTNTCSYLPSETVLPKNSLLYCRFTILNEINNIKVNGVPIPVKAKQGVFRLFEERKKVTLKMIRDYLKSEGVCGDGDVLGGLDETVKSTYKPYHDFRRLLESGALTVDDVEDIIGHITYTEDKSRLTRWLKMKYTLSDTDLKYVSRLKYADFGRLSRRLLEEVTGTVKATGEYFPNIITVMWETNDNFMQIAADPEKYTFCEQIEKLRAEFYANEPVTAETVLDEMYISNAVKRPIFRALDVVRDVRKAAGRAPARIFVEMARGGGEKGKRTRSRRDQILDLYKLCDKDEVRELSKQLEGKTDNELRSEVLFLYFMQLGKCMYCGEAIDIGQLKSGRYNVDHIHPQSKVTDDSLDNKVLVCSKENSAKGDDYPVPAEYRGKMRGFWEHLKKVGLISDEKFKRLTRGTEFTDEEKQGFINRQLVETRQSTKAVARILGNMFPDTEIVYVKAGLVSDYRHLSGLLKSRGVNDLHHAKDAYLNIVCGNVYHERFTKNFFLDSKYSVNPKSLFANPVVSGGVTVWRGEEDNALVKKTVLRNNAHYTRFAFVKTGGFFDQMPVRAAEGLVERKKGLDTAKYGGYNKPSAACYILARYTVKNKPELMFVPVELMYASKVFSDEAFAVDYIRRTAADIENKEPAALEGLTFPLGLRPIKINTVVRADGYDMCITGKSNGGACVLLKSLAPIKLSAHFESYVQRLESYDRKRADNKSLRIYEDYDGINAAENLALYDELTGKLTKRPFSLAVFANQLPVLRKGRERFIGLSLEEQTAALLNMILLFKTSRAGTVDFSLIGGMAKSGLIRCSSKLSNWKKNYKDVRIVDVSPAGLHEQTSENLLGLL